MRLKLGNGTCGEGRSSGGFWVLEKGRETGSSDTGSRSRALAGAVLAPGTGLHLETVLILPAGEGAPACAEAAPQMTGCLAGSSQGAAPSANTAFRLGGSLPLEHQAPSPREGHILSHLALLATTLKAVPEKLPSAAPLEGKHPGGSSAGLSLGDGAGSFTRVPVQGLWPHQRRTRGGHPCALWWPLLLETLALHQVLVPVAAAAQRPSRARRPGPLGNGRQSSPGCGASTMGTPLYSHSCSIRWMGAL